MADTSIKVDEQVRDRLAQLAREQGTTIRDLVAELAATRLTIAEAEARYTAARAHVTEHLCPELTEADTDAGWWVWAELAAGRLPITLSPPAGALAPNRADTVPGDAPAGRDPGHAGQSRRAG